MIFNVFTVSYFDVGKSYITMQTNKFVLIELLFILLNKRQNTLLKKNVY